MRRYIYVHCGCVLQLVGVSIYVFIVCDLDDAGEACSFWDSKYYRCMDGLFYFVPLLMRPFNARANRR